MSADDKKRTRLRAIADRGWAALDELAPEIGRLAAEKAMYADTPDDDIVALVLAFAFGELMRRRKDRTDPGHPVPRGPHFHGDRGERPQ